jgi:hypothetical protein
VFAGTLPCRDGLPCAGVDNDAMVCDVNGCRDLLERQCQRTAAKIKRPTGVLAGPLPKLTAAADVVVAVEDYGEI